MELPYKIKPYQHQHEAIEKSKELRDFGLLWDVGTGKTGAAINILRYKYAERGKLRKTLIITPIMTLFNWADEFGIHSNVPRDKIVIVTGSKTKKLKQLQSLYDLQTGNYCNNRIVITNYETLLSKDVFPILKAWGADIIVFDESHYIKNHKAKRSKQAVILADRADHRYILSGTPILKNAQDIFMQFRAFDCGLSFGQNFYVFQRTYMQDANSSFSHSQQHFPKWELREDKTADINAKIYEKCTRVDKDECLDLPPLIKQTIKCYMTAKQMSIYKQMKRDLITFIETREGNKAVVAQVAVVKALRLMQIASGFAKSDDGTIVTTDNPKADVTKELLEQTTQENKVILWCAFRHDYVVLSKICEELGIGYQLIQGGMTASAKDDALQVFRKDTGCRAIIINRAIGVGFNLVEAGYSIVYSRNFALGQEIQSEGRNYRGGSQMHKQVVKIDLVMADTIEEDVVKALQDKKDIAESILSIVRR